MRAAERFDAGETLEAPRRTWLFSPAADLAVFGLPAAVALVLVATYRGPVDSTPEWLWLGAILAVDVAHVYGTVWRVYADIHELRRRPWLYLGVPCAVWAVAALLYAHSPLWFWRALAYTATFHFVRQQAGWLRLYRGDGWDSAALHAAMLYPLWYWHTHPARNFAWMLPGDFVLLPGAAWDGAARAVYVALLAMYATRAVGRFWRGAGTPGQDVLVISTAACWYVGIVATNSDFAFTVTNVLIHGIPYMALIYLYGSHRAHAEPLRPVWEVFRHGPALLLAALWACAFAEEWAWDHTLWHERPYLFGIHGFWDAAAAWAVPLLSVPQWTHYILDGVVWRRADNPTLRGLWSAQRKGM